MKHFVIKIVTTILLLALPMYVIGQNQSDSVIFVDQGSPGMPMITYYHAIPGRFFIQRSNDVSQEYIISLLDQLTDATFQYSWHSFKEAQNIICRVLIEDTQIDNIIGELLKDDGVMVARRIYIQTDFFNKYVAFLPKNDVAYADYFKEPNLKNKETEFFNEILCSPINYNPDIVPQDSICKNIGVTLTPWSRSFVAQVPKKTDVFKVALQLLNTGYFVRVDINGAMPFAGIAFDDVYGDKITRSDHFFDYNGDKVYYHEIQGRFFVEKNDSVSQDYINELLNNAINDNFEKEWLYNNLCRVIVDDELIDNIINQIIEDEDIITARRIYVTRSDYNSYLFYPDLQKGERYLLNILTCNTIGKFNQALLDSISDSLGLTYRTGSYCTVIFFAPKQVDIFEVSQKLFETGGFSSVGINIQIPPIINHWSETYISQPKDEVIVKEELYYNLAGQRMESPSGMTIVVTRYSNGRLRTEKKLFRK